MTPIGITGTDTGVGKTLVAAALIGALYERGVRVAPMKPVETGAGDDAMRLRAAAGSMHPLELVRPFSYEEPLAPWLAAQRAGTAIDVTILNAAFTALQSTSDTLVVEGAGGLLVPITATETFATLFKQWNVDLLIVAANRLGAINHTLLTIECAHRYGLSIRGIVLNMVSANPPGTAEGTNAAVLRELSRVPLLEVPYGVTVKDLGQRLVKFLDA